MKEIELAKSLIVTVVFVVLGTPLAAQANDKTDLAGKSVKVSYADLNLKKQEGAKTLYRRLKQASRKACGYEGYRIAGSLQLASKLRRCYQESLTSAVEALDNDLVTEIHNS